MNQDSSTPNATLLPAEAPQAPQALWTTPEVAAFLHVSVKTVFNLRLKKGLPFVQLGGAVRFVPGEVRAYLVHSRHASTHRLRQMFNKGVTA